MPIGTYTPPLVNHYTKFFFNFFFHFRYSGDGRSGVNMDFRSVNKKIITMVFFTECWYISLSLSLYSSHKF